MLVSRAPIRCKVCTAGELIHPNADKLREQVDVWYSRGLAIVEISRRVNAMCDAWPRKDVPAHDSITRHTKNHTVDSVNLSRAIAYERMRQAHTLNTELAEQFMDPVVDTTFQLAVAAHDRVALGIIVPRDTSDAIKAVEAWDKFRPTFEAEGISPEEHQADLALVIEQARRHMPKDAYKAFIDSLKATGRELSPGPD